MGCSTGEEPLDSESNSDLSMSPDSTIDFLSSLPDDPPPPNMAPLNYQSPSFVIPQPETTNVTSASDLYTQSLGYLLHRLNALYIEYHATRLHLDAVLNEYHASLLHLDALSNEYEYHSTQLRMYFDMEHPERNDDIAASDVCSQCAQSRLYQDLGLGSLSDDSNETLDMGSVMEVDEDGVLYLGEEEEDYRVVSGNDNDNHVLMLPLRDSNFENLETGVNEREVLDMFSGDDVFETDLNRPREIFRRLVLDHLYGHEWENFLMGEEFPLRDFMKMELSLEDEIMGRLFEGEDVGIGNPPASEEALENLVIVVVGKEDIEMGNVTCAVCKDGMNVGEEARELPCRHRYHNDCIFPWLRIRNTCPVCRYELTTDDPDYENRRAHSAPGRAN